MKIYVDFDRTLFDCDKFLSDLYALVSKYNISKELFKECQNQCIKEGFNPYNILNLVKEKYSFDDNLYLEIDSLMKKTKDYLFLDSINFLEYLKSLNYEIVILTKGNSDYQREKIFNAKIDKYYNKLIVSMEHKGNLDLDYKNSVFIDDNPIEIQSILNNQPKLIIRIKRDNTLYSSLSIDNILTFNSLKEVIDNKIL